MGVRVGLLFLFVLSWASDARELVTDISSNGETVISDVAVKREVQALKAVGKNKELCKMCEEFSLEALNYFAENKTQTEIMDILHKSCSRMLSFKKQCITLVDYYAPLFFLELATVQPKEFCRKVGLCKQSIIISQAVSKNSCDLCRNAVAEVLLKLKDPDTELDIIEVLLKVCDTVGSRMKKCKRLVFEYGPLILVNTEQFLEKTDLCTTFHACAQPSTGEEPSILTERMFSDA